MVIEILYSELYTYGEKGNIDYIEKMFSDAKTVYTKLIEEPYFVKERPDLVIIGPMAEPNLEKVQKKLAPYVERIKELIDDNIYFIAFNNVLDILGTKLYVENEGEKDTLGIFDFTAKRDYEKRKSELVVAKFDGEIILGANIGFSEYFGNEKNYLYETLAGRGFNSQTKLGGFRHKNAFLVEMIGNIFMYNPNISKRLLKIFGYPEKIPFEKEVQKSYEQRIESWKKDNVF